MPAAEVRVMNAEGWEIIASGEKSAQGCLTDRRVPGRRRRRRLGVSQEVFQKEVFHRELRPGILNGRCAIAVLLGLYCCAGYSSF